MEHEDLRIKIMEHIDKNLPFILYSDEKNFVRCYTAEQRVREYRDGICVADELPQTKENFAHRVGVGAKRHGNFSSLEHEAKHIESGAIDIATQDCGPIAEEIG